MQFECEINRLGRAHILPILNIEISDCNENIITGLVEVGSMKWYKTERQILGSQSYFDIFKNVFVQLRGTYSFHHPFMVDTIWFD